MSRLTLLPVVIFSVSFSLQAATNVKSYPASLCYQSTGPENSARLNGIGNVSNSDEQKPITLFCPVMVAEDEALRGLEVKVVVIDEDINGEGVSCQVSGSQHGQRFTSRWGTAATSESGSGLQEITTRLTQLKQQVGPYVKANLSCSLPPASQYEKVSLVSYQVTELYQ